MAHREGRINQSKNMRKFLSTCTGTELFWRTRISHGHGGHFKSNKNKKKIWCDSSWELARVSALESNDEVVTYRKIPFSIEYRLNGKSHYYRPDFLIHYKNGPDVLEEVKPKPLMKLPINLS